MIHGRKTTPGGHVGPPAVHPRGDRDNRAIPGNPRDDQRPHIQARPGRGTSHVQDRQEREARRSIGETAARSRDRSASRGTTPRVRACQSIDSERRSPRYPQAAATPAAARHFDRQQAHRQAQQSWPQRDDRRPADRRDRRRHDAIVTGDSERDPRQQRDTRPKGDAWRPRDSRPPRDSPTVRVIHGSEGRDRKATARTRARRRRDNEGVNRHRDGRLTRRRYVDAVGATGPIGSRLRARTARRDKLARPPHHARSRAATVQDHVRTLGASDGGEPKRGSSGVSW